MKIKTAGIKWIVFILVPALFCCLTYLLWPMDYILVTTIKDGRTILALPLDDGPDFSIGYIHSVDIKPVFECFTVKPGPNDRRDIYIVATYFRMFGAGMGHWRGHGRLVGQDGWTWIKDIDKNVGEFILRIGSPGVDHTVYYGHAKYNLSESAPGQAALFQVVPGRRVQAIFGYGPDHAWSPGNQEFSGRQTCSPDLTSTGKVVILLDVES